MKSQALDMEKRLLILPVSENLYSYELLMLLLIFSFFCFVFVSEFCVFAYCRRRVASRRCRRVGRVGRNSRTQKVINQKSRLQRDF